ncbi:hypothetical protein LSPCS325_26640 [Lysinibacillus sp. CTST325]
MNWRDLNKYIMVNLILEKIKWDQHLQEYMKKIGEYYHAINTIDSAVPEIEGLTVNVIRPGINKNKPAGVMLKCCPHSSYLLDGFEVISEVSKVER